MNRSRFILDLLLNQGIINKFYYLSFLILGFIFMDFFMHCSRKIQHSCNTEWILIPAFCSVVYLKNRICFWSINMYLLIWASFIWRTTSERNMTWLTDADGIKHRTDTRAVQQNTTYCTLYANTAATTPNFKMMSSCEGWHCKTCWSPCCLVLLMT